MVERIVITADEGKVLTNGEVYGTTIYLEEGKTSQGYYEITEEEYNGIIEAEAEEIVDEHN